MDLWPKPHYVGTVADTSDWSWSERFSLWLIYEWWPTRRWMPKLSAWWYYNVRHYPKPPPFAEDRVAHHFGFVEGIPPCTDGPFCAKHGWRLSPLVTDDGASSEGLYAGCPAYAEHGACYCSTGVLGNCVAAEGGEVNEH